MARVRVQSEPFDTAAELAHVQNNNHAIGACVSFTGLVRDLTGELSTLTLEHYPAMTEAEIQRWAMEAEKRWSLEALTVIHRYGTLTPGEPIVLVIAASKHRAAAFEAAEFLMDKLKTEAPFWKRETTEEGTKWIDAAESDDARAARWDKS